MWVFTTHGFLSVVEHRQQPDTLIVRARVRSDLNAARERYFPSLTRTEFSDKSDYPYRGQISRKAFAKGMRKVVADITYGNFKNAVEENQGNARSSIYMRIWSALIDLELDKRRIEKYFSTFLD